MDYLTSNATLNILTKEPNEIEELYTEAQKAMEITFSHTIYHHTSEIN